LSKSVFSDTARGLIIAYGIGAYVMLRHHLSGAVQIEPGFSALTMILIGLLTQVLRWLVLRAVSHYEENRGLNGTLSPTVKYAVDLASDGVTVLLFALGTFRGIAEITASV
jgi:hypothetical protein